MVFLDDLKILIGCIFYYRSMSMNKWLMIKKPKKNKRLAQNCSRSVGPGLDRNSSIKPSNTIQQKVKSKKIKNTVSIERPWAILEYIYWGTFLE
jgi:hypothetical protein